MTKGHLITRLLIETHDRLLSLGLLLLRCTVGIILFMAGSGKVLGWFGGQGLGLTLQNYAKGGFSAPLAYLSSYTEFIGGLLILVGFLTRPAAFAVMINMLVATLVMLPRGFIMGMAAYPFSLLVSAVIILLAGPMAYSLDALLLRTRQNPSGIQASKAA